MSVKDFRTPKKPKYRPRGDSSPGPTTEFTIKAPIEIRKYVQKSQKLDPKERWLSYPEIPAAKEILGLTSAINQEEGQIDIVPNQIDGPWASREDYLGAHCELLREDSVALLRDTVAYVKEDPTLTDTHETCVYDKVRNVILILGFMLETKCLTGLYHGNNIFQQGSRHKSVFLYCPRREEYCVGILQSVNCWVYGCIVASRRLFQNPVSRCGRGGSSLGSDQRTA
jgi:hypothetical protein